MKGPEYNKSIKIWQMFIFLWVETTMSFIIFIELKQNAVRYVILFKRLVILAIIWIEYQMFDIWINGQL